MTSLAEGRMVVSDVIVGEGVAYAQSKYGDAIDAVAFPGVGDMSGLFILGSAALGDPGWWAGHDIAHQVLNTPTATSLAHLLQIESSVNSYLHSVLGRWPNWHQ